MLVMLFHQPYPGAFSRGAQVVQFGQLDFNSDQPFQQHEGLEYAIVAALRCRSHGSILS